MEQRIRAGMTAVIVCVFLLLIEHDSSQVKFKLSRKMCVLESQRNAQHVPKLCAHRGNYATAPLVRMLVLGSDAKNSYSVARRSRQNHINTQQSKHQMNVRSNF